MPRMRSASIPLLGLDETRMRASSRALKRLCPIGAQRTQRARQALLEALRGGIGLQAAGDEHAEALLNPGAHLAAGAEADVRGVVDVGWFVEQTVEEEIDSASYV